MTALCCFRNWLQQPSTAIREGEAAYQVALYVTGVPRRHPYAGRIHHVYPDVQEL